MNSFKTLLTVAAILVAAPAIAAPKIGIEDPYVRSATATAPAGAAFMTIRNQGDEDDRLVSASSDVADKVEIHTTRKDAAGVMQMIPVEGGLAVPAQGEHTLARGADHVMLMGLRQPLNQGDKVKITLHFEKSGDVVIEAPVDRERGGGHMGGQGHGGGQGQMGGQGQGAGKGQGSN